MHGVLYYRPLHRDNWGLILVLIEINRAYIILFSTNCHQFTIKWHQFIIKNCLVYMIQPSIFREINIPIEIPVKKSAPSCHDEEACSRVRHACMRNKQYQTVNIKYCEIIIYKYLNQLISDVIHLLLKLCIFSPIISML